MTAKLAAYVTLSAKKSSFVRTDPEAAYAFCGQGVYLSHEGDRPIGVTWRLESALPAGLYQRYATLVVG